MGRGDIVPVLLGGMNALFLGVFVELSGHRIRRTQPSGVVRRNILKCVSRVLARTLEFGSDVNITDLPQPGRARDVSKYKVFSAIFEY